MTPKEKAVDLVENFIVHTHECDKLEAKQCALIAIDIVIQQEAERCLAYRETDKFVDYWEEVKQEIQKLS